MRGHLTTRGRTLLAGKIIFNFGQSSLDCVVRRITEEGATIELESGLGVPEHAQLLITSEDALLPCRLVWRSDKEIGVTFEGQLRSGGAREEDATGERSGEQILRSQMFALRSALDQVPIGVILLDPKLKARFINRAFRQMTALPAEVAERHPSFTELMYHGRDTGAYDMPADRLQSFVAERIASVKSGESKQLDLRWATGDVMRMHCTPLPDGGRMLSYMAVTDIVRQADELKVLRDALENVQDGVLLLDADLNAIFMNRKVRQFWEISEEEAASKPPYASLISRARRALEPNLPVKELTNFAAKRVAEVKAGNHVRELQTPDNRRLRAHCTNMVGGGRMIIYYDVTDLMRNAEELQRLATTDPLTGLYNRRHFIEALEAEWSRFSRYYRRVSVLMVDIDHFKSVNDRFGHSVGDEVLKQISVACLRSKRKSDVVGRLGGEEFAILLPETSLSRAKIVAERIRKRIAEQRLKGHETHFQVTASIRVAEASTSMSGTDALMKAADQALYQTKAQGRDRCVSWSPSPHAKLAAG